MILSALIEHGQAPVARIHQWIEQGESILYDASAAITGRVLNSAGNLYLTDDRLVFVPNRGHLVKKVTQINLDDIRSVRRSPSRLLGIPVGRSCFTVEANEHRYTFNATNRDDWIQVIANNSGLGPSN